MTDTAGGTRGDPPALGFGIGWRPGIADIVAELPGLGFVEVIAEHVDPRDPPRELLALRERGVPVIPHGLTLNLGAAERPEPARLARLAAVARALDAPLVSEHVAVSRAGGLDSGHLLPVPRTWEALAIVADNVRAAAARLPVPLALENVAPLLAWPGEEMTDGTFLGELAEASDARLLLDIANLHTAHVNLGQDPTAVLDDLPLDRVAYVHVAGGVRRDGRWHDTHLHPVTRPILAILAALAARVDPPGVLLERDGRYPPAGDLAAELALIRRVVEANRPGPRGPRPPLDRPPAQIRRRPSPWRARAARRRLADAEGELLAALVVGAPPPPGFDLQSLAVQRDVLARKRAQARGGDTSEAPRA